MDNFGFRYFQRKLKLPILSWYTISWLFEMEYATHEAHCGAAAAVGQGGGVAYGGEEFVIQYDLGGGFEGWIATGSTFASGALLGPVFVHGGGREGPNMEILGQASLVHFQGSTTFHFLPAN